MWATGAWILSVSASARDVCSDIVQRHDPVDQNVLSAASVSPGRGLVLEVQHHTAPPGEQPQWRVIWVMVGSGIQDRVLPVGHTLHLVLEDGRQLAMPAFLESAPRGGAYADPYGAAVWTTWVGQYAATPEDIGILSASPPVVLQVRIDDEVFSDVRMETQRKKYLKDVARLPELLGCLPDPA